MVWTCSVCTFENLNDEFLCCEVCTTQRAAPGSPVGAAAAESGEESPSTKQPQPAPTDQPLPTYSPPPTQQQGIRGFLSPQAPHHTPKNPAPSPGSHSPQQPLGGHSPRQKLDEPCETFDPSRPWGAGSPVPYAHLSEGFELLLMTRKRTIKERVLVNLFRTLLAHGSPPDEVAAACYLCSPAKDAQSGGHRLRPDWEGTDVLGVGPKSIRAAIMEATCASPAQFRNKYAESREASDSCLALQQGGGLKQSLLLAPPPLTLLGVYKSLLSLAKVTGARSDQRKTQVAECPNSWLAVTGCWHVRHFTGDGEYAARCYWE